MFTLLSILSSLFVTTIFLLIIALIYYVLRYLWELIPLTNLKSRAVFITGCDSGFGYGIAIKCAKNGIPTFAGCYTEEGRKKLVQETSGFPNKLHAILVDVSKDESVQNAYDYVKNNLEPGQQLWAVLNNAGTNVSYGPDEWTSIDMYRKSAEVNTYGAIRVTHTFLPLLKQSNGRILSTTSVQGRVATVYYGPYGVSKFALEGYMDIIRRELKPWGIKCIIFNPGAFYTPISLYTPNLIETTWKTLSKELQNEYGEEYKKGLQEPFRTNMDQILSKRIDYVIDAYYHAITARFPRLRYPNGWDAVFYYIPVSNLPTELQDWVVGLKCSLIKVLPAALQKKTQ